MDAHLTLATTASLIADPARSAILLALLDGRAVAAGELARRAGISAQSASMHLAQLLQGGFVEVASQGRHRYYRIASPEVAHAVEASGSYQVRESANQLARASRSAMREPVMTTSQGNSG